MEGTLLAPCFEIDSLIRPNSIAVTTISVERERSEGPVTVLHYACQASLRQQPNDDALDNALTVHAHALNPLWPALARHIARRSTADDEELLRQAARAPAKYPEPLSWGLKYYVRGDVVFLGSDGTVTVATLDELCAEAGIDPLPLLEPMANELDIDWD